MAWIDVIAQAMNDADLEQGKRKMPEYVYELVEYKVSRELLSEVINTK